MTDQNSLIYRNLTIENFKGFQRLEITDFRRVNLFVGKNNSGKSSVLESLLLVSQNGETIEDSLKTLTESFNGQVPEKPLFKQFDLGNAIRIRAETWGKGPRETSISLSKKKLHSESNSKEMVRSVFIHSKDMPVVEDIEQLMIEKKDPALISSLKQIDPNIQTIQMVGSGGIYLDLGLNELAPIGILGDGINRMVLFLSAVINARNGVLLIDEIENGLHYSAMSVMWKALIASAEENNVQIFATTHSYECVKALSEAKPERIIPLFGVTGSIRVFRIDRDNYEHLSTRYDADDIKTAVEDWYEIR
ncbi:MAG: AAA family ATPase [Deltaproteobacteria bacterium]|nr:AAA family ATPase [Deltaproteobacteria bacterium]